MAVTIFPSRCFEKLVTAAEPITPSISAKSVLTCSSVIAGLAAFIICSTASLFSPNPSNKIRLATASNPPGRFPAVCAAYSSRRRVKAFSKPAKAFLRSVPLAKKKPRPSFIWASVRILKGTSIPCLSATRFQTKSLNFS